jgi:hypothetical protein
MLNVLFFLSGVVAPFPRGSGVDVSNESEIEVEINTIEDQYLFINGQRQPYLHPLSISKSDVL